MDPTNVPGLLPLIREAGAEGTVHDDGLSYFLSHHRDRPRPHARA